MAEHDLQDTEQTPPDAERVARRALVLASCACRASLEPHPGERDAQRMHATLREWIDEIDIRDEFEEYEWAAVAAPLGSLDERTEIDMSWRTEGLVVLAWALGRAELPPYDQKADGPEVGDTIGFLDDSAGDLLRWPQLRAFDDLEWIANLTVAVHWRLRQFSLWHEAIDFRAFAPTVQWAVFPVDDLKFIDNDLALRGQPISNASDEVLHTCASIIRERQQAANWLMGDQALYSEITCDT